MSRAHWRWIEAAPAVCAIAIFALSGCGSDLYSTAKVTGTVLCNGKPATGGTIVFLPVDAPDKTGRPASSPGSRATGFVGADGTFSLSLEPVGMESKKSGALTGPHLVVFNLPDSADAAPLECGRAIWPDSVDVKAGSNNFKFVLLPESFVPPPSKKDDRNIGFKPHIKIDPSQVDPKLLDEVKK